MPGDFINRAAELMWGCSNTNGTIFVCGNGGSSATAAHFVNDMLKGAGFRIINLSDNTPSLSAMANDIAYEQVFAFPLSMMGRENDLLVAISGSDNSPNIIAALDAAEKSEASSRLCSPAMPEVG
jgi:D-sedoheptulose 7-phosphate isomerase